MNIRRALIFLNYLAVTVVASAQIVNCSSDDGHRRSCPANTSNGVRMQRQISGSACTAGYSWGYESGFVWVDHGCRADFGLNVGALPQRSSQEAMRSCKNAVNARQPNIPLAFIQVDAARTNGASLMADFRVQPPNGPRSSGYCDVFQNGRVNVVFRSSGNAGNSGGNYGGPSNGQSQKDRMQNALWSCKEEVSNRRPNVPRAYIDADHARLNGGSIMADFRVQPPNGPRSSGYCDVFQNGKVNVVFNSR